jgi:hypothetical protein
MESGFGLACVVSHPTTQLPGYSGTNGATIVALQLSFVAIPLFGF